MGWKKGKLFEWGGGRMGAGTDGQAQHKVLFLLPGWQGKAQGPGGQILPRSASESMSVLCKGNAISMETSLFFLLPAAMALVPVLLQLGEGWLCGLLGAGGGGRGHACHWGFSEQQLESAPSFLSLPSPCYPLPAMGTWVGSCALMLSPGGPVLQSCWLHWGCPVSLAQSICGDTPSQDHFSLCCL